MFVWRNLLKNTKKMKKNLVDPDDHLQEAGPSGWLFAKGWSLQIIVCKRPAPPDDQPGWRGAHQGDRGDGTEGEKKEKEGKKEKKEEKKEEKMEEKKFLRAGRGTGTWTNQR